MFVKQTAWKLTRGVYLEWEAYMYAGLEDMQQQAIYHQGEPLYKVLSNNFSGKMFVATRQNLAELPKTC